MRHSLFRNLLRDNEAASFHSINPSSFPLRNPSLPQSLGTKNNIQRQTQRQLFHFNTKPRLTTIFSKATPFSPNPTTKRTSKEFSVNMPPKRKSTHAEPEPQTEQATRRRSSRLTKGAEPAEEVVAVPVRKKADKPKPIKEGKAPRRLLGALREEKNDVKEEEKVEKVEEPPTKRSRSTKPTTTKSSSTAPPSSSSSSSSSSTAKQYWLLKAEPQTRLENGHDVHFSIDDLASRTSPEPWDGIRNYSARNNLRSMKLGDLAFFYHSNCPSPGIVGVMEIVKEAEPDWTAVDPKAAYFDAKAKAKVDSGGENPWSLVHVVFREKFARELGLKELRSWAGEKGKGGALENMQLIRQSRLSVSKVSEEEWKFLMEKAGGRTGREGKGKGK